MLSLPSKVTFPADNLVMIKISSVIFVWTIHLGQLFLLTGSVPCIVHSSPPPPKKKLLKFKQLYNSLHLTTTKDFSAVRL